MSYARPPSQSADDVDNPSPSATREVEDDALSSDLDSLDSDSSLDLDSEDQEDGTPTLPPVDGTPTLVPPADGTPTGTLVPRAADGGTPTLPPACPDQIDWSKKTIPELKAELRRLNLPVGGVKAVLVERIVGTGTGQEANTIPAINIQLGPDWTTKKVAELKDELRRRCLTLSGNRLILVQRILDDDVARNSRAEEAALLRDLSTEELLALQNLAELAYDIECRKDDLIEYRSHLARHLSEDEYAKKELSNLADDEAIVTSDYKMKILACFFRENQKKWFGKRGTSMLGFMITTNSTDEGDKEKGVKKISFVMMVTDDCLQDEHEVACAKNTVYKKYLPDHVTKVRFTSDGAGCFKSQFHRAFQPFWKVWTGIDEISYRITPAGDGKSCLDGMFGRLNAVLQTAVDSGMSYWDSETILEALEESQGLAATEFALFAPDRSRKVEVDLQRMTLESVLLTTLDPDRESTDQSSYAWKHGGYGNGAKIIPSMQIEFKWRNGTSKKKKKKDLHVIEGVYNNDVSILCLLLVETLSTDLVFHFIGRDPSTRLLFKRWSPRVSCLRPLRMPKHLWNRAWPNQERERTILKSEQQTGRIVSRERPLEKGNPLKRLAARRGLQDCFFAMSVVR